jgi:hypothetical protein
MRHFKLVSLHSIVDDLSGWLQASPHFHLPLRKDYVGHFILPLRGFPHPLILN